MLKRMEEGMGGGAAAMAKCSLSLAGCFFSVALFLLPRRTAAVRRRTREVSALLSAVSLLMRRETQKEKRKEERTRVKCVALLEKKKKNRLCLLIPPFALFTWFSSLGQRDKISTRTSSLSHTLSAAFLSNQALHAGSDALCLAPRKEHGAPKGLLSEPWRRRIVIVSVDRASSSPSRSPTSSCPRSAKG